MTKQTKLELVQINARLAAENEALRKQVADLRLSHDLLLAEISHWSPPKRQVAQRMPQWQLDRAAAMQAAREMAMRSGRAVKV